jgi:hypothetical protein
MLISESCPQPSSVFPQLVGTLAQARGRARHRLVGNLSAIAWPKQISVLSETGEGQLFEEWVGEASVCDFEIVPQPPESLCSQKPSWSIGEHCVLTGLGVRYRSVRKLKWKFRLYCWSDISSRKN